MATKKKAATAPTRSSTNAAAEKPPVEDSEARRYVSGTRRNMDSPATIRDVVGLLEHLGLAGEPVSRGEPEDEDE